MEVYFDYSTYFRPGNTKYQSNVFYQSATGDLSGGVPLFIQYINPGHGGTSETLSYDFRFTVSGGATGTTATVAWQYRSAGSTAWAAIASTIASFPTTSAVEYHMVGISTVSMTCPIAVRALFTAAAATAVTISCANTTALMRYPHFRVQGHITA